jgi:Rrf2 family transcriptional regulator, iron-sulfur cluster assembly transcription factor
MITRECDYALRALVLLARRAGERRIVSTTELSAAAEIPHRFLRKIVRRMTAAGLVRSHRGKAGGLELAIAPREMTVWQVLQAMDPTGAKLNRCTSDAHSCERSGACAVHREMQVVQDLVDMRLAEITLARLLE